MEFFEKHNHVFEDTEENKLEYSPIYESYVYILESVIDSRLIEKFMPSETEEFYKTFKDNLQTYEAINSDTLDTLYGFIDFDKFKDKMIKFKETADKDTKQGADVTTQNVGVSSLELNDASTIDELLKEDIKDKKVGWALKLDMKEKNGISCVMHTRPMVGKGTKLMRSEILMRGISKAAFA